MNEKQLQVTATFSAPLSLVHEMDTTAKAFGISRSELIRNAIDAALEEHARAGYGRAKNTIGARNEHAQRRPTEEEWKVLLDWVDKQVRHQSIGGVEPDLDRQDSDVEILCDEGQDQGGPHHDR